jgi:hypothetical protein
MRTIPTAVHDAIPDPLNPVIADTHEEPGGCLTHAVAQETYAEGIPPRLTGVVLRTRLLTQRLSHVAVVAFVRALVR